MSYFLLYGAFALWVLFDALTRKMGAWGFLWALGTAILGPIILAVYLASRPLKQGDVREGGRAWNILKNFAILWTIVMVVATIAAVMAMAKGTAELTSDAARAGAGVGIVLGIAMLGAVWFFPTMGAVLLGFLLKKNTIVETGPTGPLVGQDSAATAAGGWAGVAAAAFLGLIALAVASISTGLHPTGSATSGSKSEPSSRSSIVRTTDENQWTMVDSRDKMDNTPRVILTKSGTSGASIVIRCVKHETQAYVSTDTVVDDGSVRIKFDQAPPVRQSWERSTDYRGLFAPDAVTFARELAKAKTFMIEFTPFQEGARSISFDVSNLATKLQRISQACDWAGVDESRARAKAASDESRARANAASAALRARLAQYVHACAEMIGKWCWSDPADNLFHSDHGFAETREKALDEAVEYARMGLIGAVPTAVLPPLPPPPPKAVPTAVLPPLPPPPPPPKEEATPLRIRVGGNEQQAKLIRQPHPVYPPLAKQARIQGVVKLNAIIAKDGTIQHLEVVSGHPSLIQSALEAVKQWVYQPTLLNGEPVEVVTQIDVNFTVSQ